MTDHSKHDNIYAAPRGTVSDFVFDGKVAKVFSDMISRSVPGYATVINMTSVLANQYVKADSRCYDLGCSLGASSMAMQSGIRVPGCSIIAVDNSQAMLEQAGKHLAAADEYPPIELICSDVMDLPLENASMVVLNFTLQFIPPERRLELLQRIHDALRPGGILVLSEKIAFEDPEEERLQIEMHHAFKRANGYNELEISQKRTALENVMIPETLATHKERLGSAGFSRADLWFQCFNFVSLVAHR
ncbi:MAG: carboxy-S-adenosyl-L-methionine synthase CmoA [Sedimenticola sp.]